MVNHIEHSISPAMTHCEIKFEQSIIELSQRLLNLARQMKRDFVAVGHWQETEDVLQSAMLRFHGSMSEVSINDQKHFLALAALNIRRELLDMTRQLSRQPALMLNSQAAYDDETDHGVPNDPASQTYDPRHLEVWAQFHEAIGQLPDPQREVAELIWYFEMPQAEISELLKIDVRTVKRRWREARLTLADELRLIHPTR